jgi:uncharacterized protein
MYFRTILDELDIWKNSTTRKPLILRGARQVGKTSAVRMFAENYDEYLEFNLEQKSDRDLFENDLCAKELLQLLLIARRCTGEGRILIFIDEIQQSPQAVQVLRYLYEECPQIHIIAAGSLLEIMMHKENISFPVGRVEYRNMYPLTFKEYLLATGQRQLLEQIGSETLSAPLHALALKSFHRYVLVGGMPEIVQHYSEHEDIPSLNPIYNNLLTTYIDDISKYARTKLSLPILRHCLEMAPFEAGKRIKYAGFGQSNYSSREIGESLKTLERAMILQLLPPSTSLKIPILPDFKKSPKLQFLDTGLINYFVGLQQYFFSEEDLQSIHRGLLAEHIVVQEVLALDGNRLKKNCFWVREKGTSNAEVDLLLQHNGLLVPVEVKAGSSGRLRSLHSFIDLSKNKFAVRISSTPFSIDHIATVAGQKYTLMSVPFYQCSELRTLFDKHISATGK